MFYFEFKIINELLLIILINIIINYTNLMELFKEVEE